MSTFWHSWLYHYGVGGIFLVLGFVVMIRSGALDLSRRTHRRLFMALIAGPILFLSIHAAWIALAVH